MTYSLVLVVTRVSTSGRSTAPETENLNHVTSMQPAWQRRKEDAIESRRLVTGMLSCLLGDDAMPDGQELEKEKEIDCTFRPMTSQRTESFLGFLRTLPAMT